MQASRASGGRRLLGGAAARGCGYQTTGCGRERQPEAGSRVCGEVSSRAQGQQVKEKGGSKMGDKSPKSVRRNATQKQAKSSAADQKKQQDITAKQAVFKKK